MVRIVVLVAAGCSIAGVESLVHLPVSHAPALRRSVNDPNTHHEAFVLQRPALRGGQQDGEDTGDMMGDMIRVKEEAAENPPLPPLAEACIKVVETWWLAALIWTLNLELFCKGGLYQLLALAALVAGIALHVAKWSSLLLAGSWVSSKARQAVKRRVKPPIASAMLTYPPLAITGAGSGRFVAAGGGGRSAKGLANRATVLESEGGELVLKHHVEFDARVEAVAVDASSKIYVHNGDAVLELSGGMGGMSSPPMKKNPLAELTSAGDACENEQGPVGDVLAISGSGECMAASVRGAVHLFKRSLKAPNASFGGPGAILEADASGQQVHGQGQVCGMSFNRLSSLLVTVDNGDDSALALWDTGEERLIQMHPAQHIYGMATGDQQANRYNGCVFSECGKLIYAAASSSSASTNSAAGYIVEYALGSILKQARCVRVITGASITCLHRSGLSLPLPLSLSRRWFVCFGGE